MKSSYSEQQRWALKSRIPFPDDIEERTLCELERMEAAWRAGSYPALIDAVALCGTSLRPLPHWVAIGVVQSLRQFMHVNSGERGRNATYWAKYRDNEMHYKRWLLIQKLRSGARPLKWDEVFDRASEVLIGSPWAGGPDAIKKSYNRVQRAAKNGTLPEFYQSISVGTGFYDPKGKISSLFEDLKLSDILE